MLPINEESFTLREECADWKCMMCLRPRPHALLKPSVHAPGCRGLSHLLDDVTWQEGLFEPSCLKTQAVQPWLLTKARCCREGWVLS